MAAHNMKSLRRTSLIALAIAALSLPGLANAEEDRRGGWGNQREGNAARQERQPSWTPRSQPQAQAPAPAPAPRWSGGNNGGGQGWRGGANPPPAPADDGNRNGRNRGGTWSGSSTAPLQGSVDDGEGRRDERNWRGRERGWTDTVRRDGEGDRADRRSRDGEGDRDGRRSRDGNWRDRDSSNRDWADRVRRGDRHDRDRDRDSWRRHGSNRDYWRRSNWSNHWDRSRYRNWSGWNNHWNWTWGSHYSHWDHGWRNHNRYDWYGWRNRYPSYFQVGIYYAPYRNYSYRRLSIGFFLDALFFGEDYWIANPGYYRLPDVYGPYRWVRYYDDAVLVDIYTGEVVDVIYDFFW